MKRHITVYTNAQRHKVIAKPYSLKNKLLMPAINSCQQKCLLQTVDIRSMVSLIQVSHHDHDYFVMVPNIIITVLSIFSHQLENVPADCTTEMFHMFKGKSFM